MRRKPIMQKFKKLGVKPSFSIEMYDHSCSVAFPCSYILRMYDADGNEKEYFLFTDLMDVVRFINDNYE